MPGPIDYSRLTIQPDPDMADWWEATKQKKFLLRQCNDCGHKWYPPFPGCKSCTSMNVGWFESSGKGTVHTYNVVVQPILAHFIGAVPYVTVIAELEDGTNTDGSKTRVALVLVDDEEDVAIGLPVEVVWDDHPDQDYKMPRLKLTSKTAPNTWKYPN